MSHIKFPCDADRARGVSTRLLAVEIVRDYRERKRGANRAVTPATPIVIAGRDRITPPLMTSEERGAGDSVNSRLHRLIGRYRDST